MMRFSAGPLLFVMFANGCVIVVLCSALMGSRTSLRKLQAAQKVPRAAVPVVPEAPNPVRNQVHEEDHQWGTGGKHVLAFSLFGSNTRYTVGAIENSKLYRTVYPGWSMRVYHDNSVPSDVIDKLYANGVDLVNMSASPLRAKTTWRFTAASDKTVARFCSRDTDSRLSLREKTAVDAWINSRKKFHVMRDHPSHTRQHMILAGMWCATGDAVPDMIQLLHKRSLRDYYTQDQDFLNEAIWPIAQKSVIHHDSFSCEKHANAHPFPLQRVGYEHVGSVFIDGHLRQSDVDLLKAATPPKACIAAIVPTVLPALLLPSGFDARADQLYVAKSQSLTVSVMANKVMEVHVSPIKWKVVKHEFWSKLPTWEPATFRRYQQYIDNTTTLVDFGTWIGPTILYGSHLAGRSFGIEADPNAYAEVLMNLKLNNDTLRNVHIQPACVAVEQASMTMHTAKAGNSGSGLGDVSGGGHGIHWKVQCYDLPFLFKTWGISLDDNTFIKIDVESYECTLLPSLVDWFLAVKSKPTLHIAMHGNFAKCSSTQYKEIDRLVQGYKFGVCERDATSSILNSLTWDTKTMCNFGELVLSDLKAPL